MEWISVKDELPEYRARAGGDEFTPILMSISGLVSEGLYINGEFKSHYLGEVTPTHWMPLPEPPKD